MHAGWGGVEGQQRWTTQIALVMAEACDLLFWRCGAGALSWVSRRVRGSNLHSLASPAWGKEGRQSQQGYWVFTRPHCCHFWSLGCLIPQEGKCPLRATCPQQYQGWMLVQPRLLQNDVPGIEMGAEGSGNPKGQRETQSPAREAQTCVLVAESGR